MESNRVKKSLVILLVFLFLIPLTAGAVSAAKTGKIPVKSGNVLKNEKENKIYTTGQRWGPEFDKTYTNSGKYRMLLPPELQLQTGNSGMSTMSGSSGMSTMYYRPYIPPGGRYNLTF